MAPDVFEEFEGELFVWDGRKDALNRRKHGVRFGKILGVFFDENSWVREDEGHSELRYVRIGRGAGDKVFAVVYTYRDDMIRLISARPAEAGERRAYEAGKR